MKPPVSDRLLRLPPQDLDAERSVLGSLLLMNNAIDEIDLSVDEFYNEQYQLLFASIVTLWQRGTRGIDAVVLGDELAKRGQLADAGGAACLVDVLDAVPHAAHVRFYASIVRNKAKARAVIHACTDAIRRMYDHVDPDDLLADLSAQIDRIGVRGSAEFATMADAKRELAEQRQNPRAIGKTGLVDLDEVLGGGLKETQSIVVAGRPGSGKSVLACQIARTYAHRGEPALIVSLEMRKSEIFERYEKSYGPDGLELLPVLFEETAFKAHRIVQKIRYACRRHGIRIAILDYLQLVEPNDREMNRERQVAEVSRSMKLLARELKIPIVVACQLNRASDRENRKPRLSDLRESGSLEQDADVVMLLHESELGENSIIVAKQRGGRTKEVPVTFRKDVSLFASHAASAPWTGQL